MQVKYNTGNIEKYESKNPLKRAMVERLNNRILKIIRNEIIDGNPVRILDAGCGEGFIDRLLVDRFPNALITGLEFTADAIAIAKETNPSVKYVQGDICEMPFKDDFFDYVICTEVLEHLPEPGKALKELMRVSTGRLLVTVPHEPWFCLGNMIALKNVKRLGNPIDHINHWTKTSFSIFLNAENWRGWWRIRGSFPWIIAQYAIDAGTQNKTHKGVPSLSMMMVSGIIQVDECPNFSAFKDPVGGVIVHSRV